MSFRRYIAANSRDAMAQLRRELGDDAVILSSKRVDDGYEILAAGPHAMERLVERVPATRVQAPVVPRPPTAQVPPPREPPRLAATAPIRHGESFQEYVRRQTQAASLAAAQAAVDAASTARAAASRPASAADTSGSAATSAATARSAARYQEVARAEAGTESDDDVWKPTTFHVPPAAARNDRVERAMVSEVAQPLVPARFAQRAPAVSASTRLPTRRVAPEQPSPVPAAPAVFRRRGDSQDSPGAEPVRAQAPPPAPLRPSAAERPAAPPPDRRLFDELQAMRNQLQQQMASLSSTVDASRAHLQSQITQSLTRIQAATQHAAQSNSGRVMTRLLTAGFSPEVARKVALHAPGQLSVPEAEAWLHDVITLNLKVAAPESSIAEAGGAFALVGPTGVGKTTTVAKLAAQFAVKYGSGALGLITLDAYRIGAPEQLRTYGRILGAPVHLAQDGATLRELLTSMQNKRLVLIDTCGVSQRDGRLNEVLSMIAYASAGVPEAMRIQRVLLANAASHAETLDDAARAWRANECAGCVLTKLDEAARIGGALDCALRYKMRLFGVTNGQRVPEDWHAAHARVLAHLALRPGSDAFALAENEALAVAADNAARSMVNA